MNKSIALAVLSVSILLVSSAFASENVLLPDQQATRQLIPCGAVSKDGYFKGIRLAGKVKVVTSFPNIKVQIVNSFPDLKIKPVESFPKEVGEWQFVESFPDFTVQFVESFPDIKIQFVNSFPGVPR